MKFGNLYWRLVAKILPLIEILLSPLTLLAALWFFTIRKAGIRKAPLSRRILLSVGVFPIRDHYYEPLFNAAEIVKPRRNRDLPGLDMNVEAQLELLKQFQFQSELLKLPFEKETELRYYYNNPSFFPGDAEYLYSIIRLLKPRRIIEIGSGNSTLMMLEAINRNRVEDTSYSCDLTCVEPYEMPWLEKLDIKVKRKKVQDIDKAYFSTLEENDILFIDSSHMIRPDGDVLYEYLELLPLVKSGVVVHVHDIFTPADYPDDYFEKDIVFINEQYLVEAFLSMNPHFEIIGALNFLNKRYTQPFQDKFPVIRAHREYEPRSLWLRRK